MPDAPTIRERSPAKPPIAVLNTRPEPQASRFAADLLAAFGADLCVVTSPLMEAEFLAPDLPAGDFAALVLTSETGAEAAARLRQAGRVLPDLAFCVGDRTAEAAKRRGFKAVSAAGDAGDLVRLLLSREDPGRLLYLHGEDRAADLAAALAPSGRKVQSAIAYRQRPRALSQAAAALLVAGGRVILPLFSPRSARLFLAAAADLPAGGIWPVVISENARAALPEALAARAILAGRPDGPAMMAAISRCYTALP